MPLWQRETHNLQFKDKRKPRNCDFEASLVFKEMKHSLKNPRLNGIKVVVTSAQGPHSVNPVTCEGKRPEEIFLA